MSADIAKYTSRATNIQPLLVLNLFQCRGWFTCITKGYRPYIQHNNNSTASKENSTVD